MGHHHHTKKNKTTAKALIVEGVLLSQSFTTSPLTQTMGNGVVLYRSTTNRGGIQNLTCNFSLISTSDFNFTLQVASGGATGMTGNTSLASSQVSGKAGELVDITVFWSGQVSIGNNITVVGYTQTGGVRIFPGTFKVSSLLYSIPEF